MTHSRSDSAFPQKAAVIAGVGPGLGFSISLAFAEAGWTPVLVARNTDRLDVLVGRLKAREFHALSYSADLRNESEVRTLFNWVEENVGPTEVTVFNAGAQYRASIDGTGADMFEKVWRLSCYAGFLVGREAAKSMLPRGAGTIIFTGATASLRGAAEFSAFAAAKMGLRGLAQSMARELGPRGIHIASVIVDGLIDTPAIREKFSHQIGTMAPDALLSPYAVAQTYVAIHRQERSAWTHELDLRPYCEKF